MKFLLEFVTCCASAPCETRDKTSLLVMQEPRRRVSRKYGRLRGGRREWRPSLSSISEDSLASEKNDIVERPPPRWRWRWRWRRSLQKKFASMSPRDRSPSLDHEDSRRRKGRGSGSATMQLAFSPAPFMF